MQAEHDGMTLWYGADDAPAPQDSVPVGRDVFITVGIRPADPSNSIEIHYRVNQGPIQKVVTHWDRDDASTKPKSQYFRAQFPTFHAGDLVEYGVVCTCAGRQVPSEKDASKLPVSFQIAGGNGEDPAPKHNIPEGAILAPNMENRVEKIAPMALAFPMLSEKITAPSTASSPQPAVTQDSSDSQAESVLALQKNPSQDETLASVLQPVLTQDSLESLDDEKMSALPEGNEVSVGTIRTKAKTGPQADMIDEPNDPLILAGDFTIITSNNQQVTKQDFESYELSAEFSIKAFEGNGLQILHYEFEDDLQFEKNSTGFSFSDSQRFHRNAVWGPVWMKVKTFDGALLWSKEYDARDPRLASLKIRVPLQTPLTLRSPDKSKLQDKPKKLRGQVLTLSKKCPLKDLTVLVQVKAQGDTIWKIVGAATTDRAGNFSMPYPLGVFTEAQALVSAMPDSPAAIKITEVKEGNQTIADDFLYLLIKDSDCQNIGATEDCDCDTPKKASRLPDQADLIESDEYTQDIGGSCINLSTPNRTLSEFNYQAIVRTSDPDVANYTLRKVGCAQEGIEPVLVSDIRRDVTALDSAVRNSIFFAHLEEQKLLDAWAKVDALERINTESNAAELDTALGYVDALIALFSFVPDQRDRSIDVQAPPQDNSNHASKDNTSKGSYSSAKSKAEAADHHG